MVEAVHAFPARPLLEFPGVREHAFHLDHTELFQAAVQQVRLRAEELPSFQVCLDEADHFVVKFHHRLHGRGDFPEDGRFCGGRFRPGSDLRSGFPHAAAKEKCQGQRPDISLIGHS